jgi:hypothetical protein
MATIVLTLESICAGGGHAHISATVNGVNKGEWGLWAEDVLADISDKEIERFMKLIIPAHKIGKTKAQKRPKREPGGEFSIPILGEIWDPVDT